MGNGGAVIAGLALLVALQWVLVTAAVEAFRVGHQVPLLSAMGLSGLCFASTCWLVGGTGGTRGPENEG